MNNKNKQKKKLSLPLRILMVLIILVTIVLCAAILSDSEDPAGGSTVQGSSAEEAEETKPAEQIIEISAEDLFDAYDENEVAADNQYKGKKLKITGTVSDIGKDVLDNTYITLDSGDYFLGVQCYFKRDELDAVAELRDGDTVTLIGVCDGKSINILINDCKIQ